MDSRLARIQDWESLARKADFNAGKLAKLCQVSPRQLERFFAKKVHQTPGQWLRRLQCWMATELVARGYTTKEVAVELKFSNASHFCREFKKNFGASPMKFCASTLAKQPDAAFGL